MKLTNAEGVEHKLSKKQLQAIEFNKALLAMYTNQVRETGLQKVATTLLHRSLGGNGYATIVCQKTAWFRHKSEEKKNP